MAREPGLSVRFKLTLSYAGFLMVAGALLLAVVWLFLLRYVPAEAINTIGGFVPGRDDLVRAFVPARIQPPRRSCRSPRSTASPS